MLNRSDDDMAVVNTKLVFPRNFVKQAQLTSSGRRTEDKQIINLITVSIDCAIRYAHYTDIEINLVSIYILCYQLDSVDKDNEINSINIYKLFYQVGSLDINKDLYSMSINCAISDKLNQYLENVLSSGFTTQRR